MTQPEDRRRRARLAVMASGTGTNFAALAAAIREGALDAEIPVLICDKPEAKALGLAADLGINSVCLRPKDFASREAMDRAILGVLEENQIDLVALAGYMRIVGPPLLDEYEGRIVNIHPSLLPDYQGLDTHARALADGVAEHGCSVHFVTEELDGGPVVIQAAVDVAEGESEASLKEKVHAREHLIYPIAVKWFLEGRLQFVPGGATLDGMPLPAQGVRLSHADAAEELDEE